MNLPRLLRDLHAEKRWLETVIAALEIASRSPTQQFAAVLVSSLEAQRWGGRILHLSRSKKAELARLAGQVRRLSGKAIHQGRAANSSVTRQPRAKVVPLSPELRRKKTAA